MSFWNRFCRCATSCRRTAWSHKMRGSLRCMRITRDLWRRDTSMSISDTTFRKNTASARPKSTNSLRWCKKTLFFESHIVFYFIVICNFIVVFSWGRCVAKRAVFLCLLYPCLCIVYPISRFYAHIVIFTKNAPQRVFFVWVCSLLPCIIIARQRALKCVCSRFADKVCVHYTHNN